MNSYEIRKIKKEDSKTLSFIQVESWKKAHTDIVPKEYLEKFLDLDYVTTIYDKLLTSNKGNGYIMEVDGSSHCMAFWDRARSPEGRDNSTPDLAEIICIHSLPKHWREGYGTIMMEALLRDIKQQGYSKVMLWVFEENHRARSFYRACGFKETGEKKISLGAVELSYIKSLL